MLRGRREKYTETFSVRKSKEVTSLFGIKFLDGEGSIDRKMGMGKFTGRIEGVVNSLERWEISEIFFFFREKS